MLTIRDHQIRVFEQAADETLCRRLMDDVRKRFSDRIPATDQELKASVQSWIRDARQLGFKTEPSITRHVVFCAENYGQPEPIEMRLQVYLRLYHENLIGGVDLPKYASAIAAFAAKNRVLADEGIAWLAVIILAGKARGDNRLEWIETILAQNTLGEEARMREVHTEAESLGWVVKERSTK